MFRTCVILSLIGLLFFACDGRDKQETAQKQEALYAVAVLPTPVFNSPDFPLIFGGMDNKTLKLNSKNRIQELEFIALPHTVFTIEQKIPKKTYDILRVVTADYPYASQTGYYIDSRFVEIKNEKPRERIKILPEKDVIIKRLISAKGTRYVWGGNVSKGIPEMLNFYRPSARLTKNTQDMWILKGLDCSGLLYEAADGYVPRNTSALFNFGSPVEIKGLGPEKISRRLKPLDLIVYDRHVLIVLSSTEVIESAATKGVAASSLIQTLKGLGKNLQPMNEVSVSPDHKGFVVRRWYPE